jgi:hypothetical protein
MGKWFMRIRCRKFLVYWLALISLVSFWNLPLMGQDLEIGEMELIERVAFLQRQLESPQIPERESAENELLKLGPLVLDHLDPVTDDTPTDVAERLVRIRLELEKIAVASVTKASRVTLQGSMTIDEALLQIREQTGNDVDLGDDTPESLGDIKIELDFSEAEFWVALAEIIIQGKLVVDPYAGQPGQLRLGLSDAARRQAGNPGAAAPVIAEGEGAPPRCVSGIFDLMVTRVQSSRNLINPERNFCKISVLVRWEPRVQPISIQLPVSTIKAIDEFDNPIVIPNSEAVLSGIVQPEIPELEFSIPIGLVDRQIEVINSFEAQIDAVLPGRMETFRFKNIGKLEAGKQQRKAGAIVTFGGIRKNEDLHGVTVKLAFEEEHNALESHQGWAFNNPCYLENSAGKKFEPVAYETLRQDNEQIAIQFYFVEDPQELTLVYRTAAAIVEIPVKVLLKGIPLP